MRFSKYISPLCILLAIFIFKSRFFPYYQLCSFSLLLISNCFIFKTTFSEVHSICKRHKKISKKLVVELLVFFFISVLYLYLTVKRWQYIKLRWLCGYKFFLGSCAKYAQLPFVFCHFLLRDPISNLFSLTKGWFRNMIHI